MKQLVTESIVSRIAGILLVAGAVIMFIGAAIPFVTSVGGEAWYGTPDSVLNAISNSTTSWKWANGLIAVAAVTTAVGLAVAVVRFPARPLAFAGLIAFGIGAGLDVTARILNMRVGSLAAGETSDSPLARIYEGFYQLSEGLIQGFIVVAFVALILFGIATIQNGTTWLGTVLVAVGAGGLVLEVAGAAIPALVYMGTAFLGVAMLWNLVGRLP